MDAEWMYQGRSNPDDMDGTDYFGAFKNNRNPTMANGLPDLSIKTPTLDELSIYQTPMRRKHSLEMNERKKAILDPGYEKFREFQRAGGDQEKTLHRKARRAEQYQAKRAGYESVEDMPIEELEAALHLKEDRAGDEQLNAAMIRVMMADPKYPRSRSGCYKRIKRLSSDEKDAIESEARAVIKRNAEIEIQRIRLERQRSCERTPPLPAREPGLNWSTSLWKERDIDKAAVREQLKRDTERFLAEGGEVEDMGVWMPDEKYLLCGKIRPLPFNMWTDNAGGGKPRNRRSKVSTKDMPMYDRAELAKIEDAGRWIEVATVRLDSAERIIDEREAAEDQEALVIESELGKKDEPIVPACGCGKHPDQKIQLEVARCDAIDEIQGGKGER